MRKLVVLFLMVAVVLVFNGASQAQSLGTAITYQGRLNDGGSVANGMYDLEFTLYDDPNVVLGIQVGSAVTLEDVNVYDGHFTVALDFGSLAFNGDSRWLEIGVRPGDSISVYTTLSPRTELTPVPYALQTRGIFVSDTGNVGIGTTNPKSKLSVGGVGEDKTGVFGKGVYNGVFGTSTNGMGVHGYSVNAYGVYGYSAYSDGVHGISHDGNGVYGTSTDGYAGYFYGDVKIFAGQLEIPDMISYPWPSGGYNVKSINGTLFYETSSARDKENIQLLREDFSKILQTRPVSYTCKRTGRKEIGFIAEEFDELGLGELVIYDQEGRPNGIAYPMVSLYLLEVLKDEVETGREQAEAISRLEEKNRKLEARLDALEKMMRR